MKVGCCGLVLIFMIALQGISVALSCTPTEPDALGPFYKPDAPVRSSVGKGYVLTGTVRSASDCSAISGAKVEFWMAGPNGEYTDAFRAILFSGSSGAYRFERPRAFVLLDHDFTVDDGTLTPSLKLKRATVMARFGGLLEELYAGTATLAPTPSLASPHQEHRP